LPKASFFRKAYIKQLISVLLLDFPIYMKKSILLVIILLNTLFGRAQSTLLIGNTPVTVDTLITGLDVPWEIVYHDGYIWTTERKGIVSRIDTATGTKQVLLNMTSLVTQQSESGLLGMALHPDFSNTPEVFLAYTYLSGGLIRERIVKYNFDGTTLINPVILLNNLPGNSTHNGCRLFFMNDTTLLASTGDTQNLSYPQDTSALNGKILRMHTDGSVPANNPFPGNLVYSYGHRNVQGIILLPNDSILLSEHGASTDDEVQILHAGRNYGWPNVEGFCNTTSEINFCNANNVVEPLTAYTPTIAPSDLIYYQNPAFPEWDNTVLMTILKNKQVRALRLNAAFDSVLSDVIYLNNLFGRLRDITEGPNKELYIATNGASWANTDPNTHSIIRITPPQVTTSLTSAESQYRVEVVPNPAGAQFELQLRKGSYPQGSKVLVYNGLGQCVASLPTTGNSVRIETESLGGSGTYLIRITDNSGKVLATRKVLVR
jgi:glucose/arabinose dehydrogenase